MVRRGAALLLVIALSLSFLISISMIDVMKSTEMTGKQSMYELSYDSHAPFNITSNSDFESQGWSGNGSATNPYLIQNLNITSTNSTCIWISNTTSHFIIEDCWFTSPIFDCSFNQLLGPITLTNASNGKVERNQIVDSQVAVSGYLLSNCSISDNSLSVSYQGINVDLSNSTVVSNNTQGYEPCVFGMRISHCRNSTISLNEFKNITVEGISVWSNYNVNIVENSFTASIDEDVFSWVGIDASGGDSCTIQRNVLSNFRFSGIAVRNHNSTVQDNNITSCQIGIYISTNNSTFTGNRIINSSISIEMDQANDTIVYSNFLLGRNRPYQTGIAMFGGHDCDIYLNIISQVGQGIYLQGAARYNVSGNSVNDSRYGFTFGWYPQGSASEGPFFDCDIVDNTFDSGGVYPIIESYESWDFDTIRFEGNTVQGRPIGFFANLDSGTIDGDSYGQLLLVNCREITISGGDFHGISSDRMDYGYYDPGQASAITLLNCTACHLSNINFNNNTYGITLQDSSQCDITGGSGYFNSWIAISLSYSEDIEITGVDIRNSLRGIDLSWSYDCSISNCLVRDNEEGIYLRIGMNCTLSNNTIFQNTDGIYMEDSDDSEIWSNTVYSNERGVLLNSSSDCLITQNNIYNNTGVGISLDNTANRNEIYNNTFAYNTPNAICEGSLNNWDNQVDTGNRWSDYSGEGAYIIDENDQDNFPIIYETTTTNGTIPDLPWFFDPLLLGIVGGGVGIIGLIIIIIDRRRIEVVD